MAKWSFKCRWGRGEPNGAFVETVIKVAIYRIDFYQNSKFNCSENVETLVYLEKVLQSLNNRTKDREDKGVEDTRQL